MGTPTAFLKRAAVPLAGVMLAGVLVLWGCASEEDSVLAPYAGRGGLSGILIEQQVLAPEVTWLGGYVSVFGVNRGRKATLDSSLIALVYQSGDLLRYPFKFGTVPSGAQSLVSAYGGTAATTLTEDAEYSFWVMKDEAWKQVSNLRNKAFVVDSALASGIATRGDTVFLSAASFTRVDQAIDIYINIKDVKTFGRLATISITQSSTTNQPLIRWTIIQSGVTDSAIAAIGITNGSQYDVNLRYWEMISEDKTVTPPVYFKNNVIHQPLPMGSSQPQTATFMVYPAGGLERGRGYYLWIANKDWDGVNRTRSTPNYAFATFTVW